MEVFMYVFLANGTSGSAGGNNAIMILVYIAFFIAIMYFMVIRPQKKKEKKTREMLSSLQVGSEVVTIGGIYGKIINIKDDDIIIETSIDKTKLNLKKWAVKEIINEGVKPL